MNNAKHLSITTKTQVMTDGMIETGRVWGNLETCDFWDKADYIMPTPWLAPMVSYLAMNIKITGRTVRYNVKGLLGCGVVRVSITIPGDCEPDTVIGGWVLANTMAEDLDGMIADAEAAETARKLADSLQRLS